ncbi:sodium/potassium/calcium exchanger 5-like [Glandiceps talaboti]
MTMLSDSKQRWKYRRRSSGNLLLVFSVCIVVAVIFDGILIIRGKTASNISSPNHRLKRELIDFEVKKTNHSDVAVPTNCTTPAVDQFPVGLFSIYQLHRGAIALHVITALYIFFALALVCDEYFVPSLETVCDMLSLQPDVAGATFMAAGSSAPEFFTSVVGVFVSQDNIGLGTIVGSAAFNLLFIVSFCGLFTGMVINLTWWPVTRDSTFYVISIGLLVYVISDNRVFWYEALLLLLTYTLYCVVMVYNRQLSSIAITAWENKTFCQEVTEEKNLLKEKVQTTDYDATDDVNESTDEQTTATDLEGAVDEGKGPSDAGADQDDINPFKLPTSGRIKRCMWFLGFPLQVLMFLTIPNCRKKRWKSWYLLTFFMSTLWLSGLSYLLVWMVSVIGYTFNIPEEAMGLTFLAAGTSIPDLISSYLVAKDGFGDMAVSNSIGSNVFDILVCLGFPWFISSLMTGEAVRRGSVSVMNTIGLTYVGIMLLASIALALASLAINKWKLDRKLGVVLMLFYFAFIGGALLYELNVVTMVIYCPSMKLPHFST